MNIDMMVFETASPEVFGPKHLIGSAVISVLIVILLLLLIKVLNNVNERRVLQVTTIFLISLELMKYAYALIDYGYFPKYFIPMQLCSFSLYLMPLVAFGKPKVSAFVMPIAFSIGLLAGLIVLVYPVTVLGNPYGWIPLSENILPIISFLYHGTMIFFSLYLVASKLYKPNLKHYFRVFVALLLFAGMGAITNAIFDTDMMFLNTANGSPFQFILLEQGRLQYMIAMILLSLVLLILPFIPTIIVNAFSRKTNIVSKVS